MTKTQTVTLEGLGDITNDLLYQIRECEYMVVHFMKKTNKSTALDVRNVSRELSKLQKKFKDVSIAFYKESDENGK